MLNSLIIFYNLPFIYKITHLGLFEKFVGIIFLAISFFFIYMISQLLETPNGSNGNEVIGMFLIIMTTVLLFVGGFFLIVSRSNTYFYNLKEADDLDEIEFNFIEKLSLTMYRDMEGVYCAIIEKFQTKDDILFSTEVTAYIGFLSKKDTLNKDEQWIFDLYNNIISQKR